jgi:hypothetical protein
MKQHYPGVADEKAHFDLVLPAFRDRRYITVDGKPLFAVYDLCDHPDPSSFIRHWQTLAKQAGLPGIYFVALSRQEPDFRKDSSLREFDAVTELAPGDFLQRLPQSRWARRVRNARHGDFGLKLKPLVGHRLLRTQRFQYADMVRAAFSDEYAGDPRFIPTVLPGWDNTPRSGVRGIVFEGSTPELFEEYLAKAVDLVRDKPAEERIVILKAWNEWAEGNYVEPDSKFGHKYLDAIRRTVVAEQREALPRSRVGIKT